jgi:hypothetical protein
MALTRQEAQITWAAADNITLATSAVQTSDVILFDNTDIACAVTVHVDNQGSPATGDIVSCWIQYTTGDVVTGVGDDYDTLEGGTFICALDTFTGTPTNGIVQRTVDIPVSPKGFRIAVSTPNAATRNVIVRARYATQRAA